MELRLIFGILGNIASMLLYCVPMLTCLRFIKKKSTEDFSCIPYLVALLNCLLYTWYGLPFVSYGWENLPLVTINGFGTFLELSFILIYFKYTSPAGKKRVAIIFAGVILVFAMIAIITVFALHNHADRKLFIGIISLFASMAMYTSPIVAVRTVIKTKSVEFMPFYLSLFTFLASGLWLLYGMASREYFVAAPNFIGTPGGLFQLLVYCKYREKKKSDREETVSLLQKPEEKESIVHSYNHTLVSVKQ